MTDAGGSDAVRYHEAARSYRSLLYTLGVLGVGYGIDSAISVHGAVTHLPGWLLFGGLLVVVQAVLLYGVRSTHSLTVTDDTVRVGDETLPRSLVTGTGVRQEDPMVLGWTDGRPRRIPTVALRLRDGRDVEVVTRFPQRLLPVLGLTEADSPPRPQPRVATAADLAEIPEIDERAEAIFRVAGYELPRIAFDTAGLDDAAVVFVVDDPPVGFAQVDVVDGAAHLAELSVLPGRMRRGLGSALVAAVCEWAAAHGHDDVTLITYADVAWNGAFYARLGFRETSELGPQLRARRERQTRLGLDAVGRRVVMRRSPPVDGPTATTDASPTG